MAHFKPVKKTTFLEAVAACIEHEKKVFEFYMRNAESLPEGPIKSLFYQLAEDEDEHIRMIGEIYAGVNGYLDKLPVGDVRRFEEELLRNIRTKHEDILEAVRTEKQLSSDTEAKLKAAVESFSKAFA